MGDVRAWSDASACQRGPVGLGWVIRLDGVQISTGASVIEVPQNSRYAEISAAELAVAKAAQLAAAGAFGADPRFTFHTDCSGLAAALAKKKPARFCKVIFRRIWALAADLGGPVQFVYIPRQKNREAHLLARGARIAA